MRSSLGFTPWRRKLRLHKIVQMCLEQRERQELCEAGCVLSRAEVAQGSHRWTGLAWLAISVAVRELRDAILGSAETSANLSDLGDSAQGAQCEGNLH